MTVHFVGAGPGAADLLTLRAVGYLRTADVCLYAGTYLDGEVLANCRPGAELIDTEHLDLDQITAHLVAAERNGRQVVRLCSGDPSIYSALAEQTRRLDRHGVPWDVTPGVSAYAAAAAVVGVELTVPELAQSVVLTRAQARSSAMPATEALANFAKTRATLVLHLAVTGIRALAAELIADYGDDCPVAVVYRVGGPQQLVLRGTLVDIADQVEAADLRRAAVILVGRVLGGTGCAESHLYDPARERPVKYHIPAEPGTLGHS